MNNWSSPTIKELIDSLKSAFQNVYFSEVEAVLTSREEKLKQENELLKKDKNLLLEKLEIERLDKIIATKQCLELKKELSVLKAEKAEFIEKSKLIENDKKKITELNAKMYELESAKIKAEIDARLCTRRFGEIESRVLSLDQVVKDLRGFDSVADDNRTKESKRVSGEIVEITDSDDDSRQCKYSSAKEIGSSVELKNALPEQEVVKSDAQLLKRKRGSSDSDDEVPGSGSIGGEPTLPNRAVLPRLQQKIGETDFMATSSSTSSDSDDDDEVDVPIDFPVKFLQTRRDNTSV